MVTIKQIIIPLISPISRKYYNYAYKKDQDKHYRAVDVRICLEYICDEIIIMFVSGRDKQNWDKYKLHKKLEVTKKFMDEEVVNRLINAKNIGNAGVHEGEEGNYTEKDITDALEAIKDFSLEIFYVYFKKYGFNSQIGLAIPTLFSTLPPIYRIKILEKYYKFCDNSLFIIDKLSKAYLKAYETEKAKIFLEKCYQKQEINDCEYIELIEGMELLEKNMDKLPIAEDLEMSRINFNQLIVESEKEERDIFILLMSMILNGAVKN